MPGSRGAFAWDPSLNKNSGPETLGGHPISQAHPRYSFRTLTSHDMEQTSLAQTQKGILPSLDKVIG